MILALPLPERTQSLGEEIANSISHGIALLAAVSATPFLIIAAADRGGIADIVGASVFAATILLLYLTSTLYHALPRNKAKRVFQILDHGAIYLLIAGTYTPFTLGVLRGAWGWTLFGLVWGLALAGRFESEIEVGRGEEWVDARSVLSLLSLAAGNGTRLRIRAVGVDAVEAVEALGQVLEEPVGQADDRPASGTDRRPSDID